MRCGSRDPAREVRRGVRERAGRERAAAREVREVRAECAQSPACREIVWHIAQVPLMKTSLAARAVRIGGPGAGSRWRAAHASNCVGRLGHDEQRHQRMLAARRIRRIGRDRRLACRRATRSSSCGPGSCPSCRAGWAPRSCGSRRPPPGTRPPAARPERAVRWRA